MAAPQVIVKALFPSMQSCAVCDDTCMCSYHDRELGWVCNICIEPVMQADFYLNWWELQMKRPDMKKT